MNVVCYEWVCDERTLSTIPQIKYFNKITVSPWWNKDGKHTVKAIKHAWNHTRCPVDIHFFSFHELKTGVRDTRSTFPGHDKIWNELFKHIWDHSLITLRFLFGKQWAIGVVPKPWLHSILFPVHEQTKTFVHGDSIDKFLHGDSTEIKIQGIIGKIFEKYLSKGGKKRRAGYKWITIDKIQEGMWN